jgi:hypothetical protein
MYWLTCENMIDIKIIHFKPTINRRRLGLFENWGREVYMLMNTKFMIDIM